MGYGRPGYPPEIDRGCIETGKKRGLGLPLYDFLRFFVLKKAGPICPPCDVLKVAIQGRLGESLFMALSFFGKNRRRSKYRGKSAASRARQLANLRPGRSRQHLLTKEISRDTLELTELDRSRRTPLASCDIIEFSEQHLGVSFAERPCQKVILKSLYGLPLEKHELKLYRRLTGNKEEFEPGTEKSEAVLVLGTRSGKSLLASICALYAATREEYRQYLSPGEIGYVVIIATRQKQCEQIVQQNVARLASMSPTLSKMIQDVWQSELSLSNGIKIVSAPCSSTAMRGIAVVMLIEDELAYFMREGPKADELIYNSLRPRMAQFVNAKFMAISTPAGRQGLLWQLFNEGSQIPGRLTCSGPTSLVNPVIPKDFLEKEKRRDPDNYRREFEAEFAQRSEQYLSDNLIAKTCRLTGELPPEPGVSYALGVDQSGLSGRDRFAVAVAYQSAGIVRVALVRAWGTKDPDRLMRDMKDIAKRYRCIRCSVDAYAKGWVSASLRSKAGLTVEQRPSLAIIYANLKNLMSGSKILMEDRLEIKESLANTQGYWSRSQNLSVGHERTGSGHGDLVDALASAVYRASQTDSGERPEIRAGRPHEDLSLFNPKNPIWGKDRAMPIPDKHYYGEEELARREGRRMSRAQADPDLETEGGD